MMNIFALLADTIAPDNTGAIGWATALTGGSATAILGWYAWYTTTKTIPGLVESFREEMKAERDQHGEETRAANERQVQEKNWHLTAFREELKEERTARKEATNQIVTALTSLTDSVKKA